MKKFFGFALTFVLIFASAFWGIGIFESTSADSSEILLDSTNFVEVLSSAENYSKTLILTENIDFSLLENPSQIYSTSKIFKGTFDGKGHTISNLNLYSTDGNFGLFTNAGENSLIKNLRIDGRINFNLGGKIVVNAGAIVGKASKASVMNCEIASTAQFATSGRENIFFNGQLNLGGFVGFGQDTKISDSATYQNLEIELSSNFQTQSNFGGMIGRQEGGSILTCLSTSSISVEGAEVDSYFAGGFAGVVEGNLASMRNLLFAGAQNENLKAIVGKISSENLPKDGAIEPCYWTSENMQAFENGSEYKVLEDDKLKYISAYGENFLKNKSNWFVLDEKGWDLNQTWFFKNSVLKLQAFESFDFSLSKTLNRFVKSLSFADRIGQTISTAFGEEVVMKIELKDEYAPFYDLSSVSIKGNKLLDYKLQTPQKGVYLVSVIASDLTDGEYSFDFAAIKFSCEVVSLNPNEGGVRDKTAAEMTDKLPLPLSYDSRAVTVVAEAKSPYTFSNWELYYHDGQAWQKSDEKFDSTNRSLEIKFGQAPFDQRFRLQAVFTDKDAISILFNDRGMTEAIESITLAGNNYIGEEIKVAANDFVNLRVVLKAGYRLDIQAFESYIKNYYGGASTATLIRSVDENENQSIYDFSINMQALSSGASNGQLKIPLAISFYGQSGQNSLLWLYITLPIVVVAGVGVAVLIILLRRKKGKAKLKEKQEKDDYKNMYI